MRKLFTFFTYTLLLTCLVLSLAIAILQTKWSRRQIHDWIVKEAAQHQMDVQFGEIKGFLPFRWHIEHASIRWGDNRINIEDVKGRLALFPLFQKRVFISYFHIHSVDARLAQSNGNRDYLALKQFSISFGLNIKSGQIDLVNVTQIGSEQSCTFEMFCSGRYRKQGKDLELNLRVNALNEPAFCDLTFQASKSKNYVDISLRTKIPTIETLSCFLAVPLKGSFDLDISSRGQWLTWAALINGQPSGSSPITGMCHGHLNGSGLPYSPWFDREWKWQTHFLLSANRELTLDDFKVQSDLIQLQGKSTFDRYASCKELATTFFLPQLALLEPHFKGSLKGKLSYTPTTALFDISGTELMFQNHPFEAFSTSVKAAKTASRWVGHGDLNIAIANISLKGEGNFHVIPRESFTLEDFLLSGPDSKLFTSFKLGFKQRALNGNLYGTIANLHNYQTVFAETELQGSLGVEGTFQYQQDNSLNQCLNLHLIGQNLQVADTLLSEFSLQAKLCDLYAKPQGEVSFDIDRLFTPAVYLSSLHLHTHSSGEHWPFLLRTHGTWKNPIELNTSGLWQHHPELFSLQFQEFKGTVLEKEFELKRPVSLAWNRERFKMSDCSIAFDQGKLFAALDLSTTHATAHLQAVHFPLDLLTIAHPVLSLQGTSSVDFSFEGDAETMHGSLSFLLEHANVAQSQTDLLKAKGSLQAHFNQDAVQIQSLFRSNNGQFLDWTGTFPLTYSLYPFHISLNRTRPLSSELTIEGRFEEIFDFINIGSHRATGQLSTHLFLSRTLDSPALQGQCELNQGTYENYFTGTTLKQIGAKAEALNDQIKLTYFQATDGQEGKVSAEGKLDLNPSAYFPYNFIAELDNLTTLRFDMITSKFSGPLYFSGSSKGAQAQGNLIVTRADFNIPDRLPVTIPTIPITFVNKPTHLKLNQIAPPSIFPLKIDLDLTVPHKAYVKGKGLNAEVQGQLHVTGTNTDIVTDGTLTLVKGEYTFSGKTFTLTQGEITFSDKPGQRSYLNLSGTLNLGDLTVTAILRGPLTAPVLTFQSVPYLPTSSILARILFNKDISEINAFQAIQIAHTIVSLSGGAGPNVLETIRKSLGVDRFDIVATDGIDSIAIQIGWYLTRGVMVTLSQSKTSSNVSVEVDLKHGFIFSAQSEEEGEGKFTLKWNRNY